MDKSRLKEAVVAITYRCNSRCRMCGIWKISDHSGELPVQEYAKLPKNLVDINITGGEPFLRKDISEIVAVLKTGSPQASITISTNGFATELIKNRMKDIIKIAPQASVVVSMDGVGKAHSRIRGIDKGYEKAMATFQVLKELGIINVKFGFTIGDYNYSELKKVYHLARSKNAELSLTLVHSSENYFSQENELSKKSEMMEAIDWLTKKELSSWHPKRWARAYYAQGMNKFLLTGKRILPDYSGQLSVFVDPKGVIYPCDISSKKMGNIKNFDQIKLSADAPRCEQSWMMCTARQSIKKHWIRVIWWIATNKVKLHLGIRS